jgi:Peptidase M15
MLLIDGAPGTLEALGRGARRRITQVSESREPRAAGHASPLDATARLGRLLMSRFSTQMPIVVILAIAIAGCGSHSPTSAVTVPTSAAASLPQGHPQAVEPIAGVQATASPGAGSVVVGDVNAHAPSLAEVKRELKQLNLCGGTTIRADAQPLVTSAGPGFAADPGTSQIVGQLPILTAELNALGKALGVTIYGISGYRTPAHSVAVGGFANDPHTKGLAEDIGVNSLLRSSAAQISESDLARFNLYRPFDPSDDPNNSEVNHVQLIPSGGPLSVAQATVAYDPDPTCQ